MSKFFLLVLAVALITACNNQKEESAVSSNSDSTQTSLPGERSSDIAAIMRADSAWDKASEAKSVDGWLGFYSDDALMMPPGENLCKDKASREASIKKMFATPGMSLRFQTTKVDLSQMNDLGYAVGVYQWISKDAKGKEYHETGKYCETWKKQSDGTWKCVVDIWNADQMQ